jgi:uridine phosphorylase
VRRKRAGAILLCMGNNLVTEPEAFSQEDYMKGVEKMVKIVLNAVKLMEENKDEYTH